MTSDPKETPGSPEPIDQTPGVVPESNLIPQPDWAEEAAFDEGAIEPAGGGVSPAKASGAAAGAKAAKAAGRSKGASSSIKASQGRGGSAGATGEGVDELPWIDDPVSKWWVGIIVGVFALIILGGFLLGQGGLLTPAKTPQPRPSPSAAPVVSAAPSLAPTSAPATAPATAAPVVTAAPTAAPVASSASSVAPSLAASASPAVAISPATSTAP